MENSVIIIWITSLYVSQPSSVVFACKTVHFGPEFQSLWVPALICSFCMPNSEFWTRITSLYGSQTLPVLLCMQNSLICTRISSLYGFQHSSVVMSTHNSVLNTRINRLYWFQLSPVVLCMQISVISTRITRLYGSQPSCLVFGCKAATYGPE